jgi:hypothetical protein
MKLPLLRSISYSSYCQANRYVSVLGLPWMSSVICVIVVLAKAIVRHEHAQLKAAACDRGHLQMVTFGSGGFAI